MAKNKLPIKFLERLEKIVGPYFFNKIKETFVSRPTTFRVNTLKTERLLVLGGLEKMGFKLRPVKWYKDAFILVNKNKKELEETSFYKNGEIYLQSLASMVPSLILDPQPGEKVLDLTAAPGSKTSQIGALMDKRGELWANELDKIRFEKLKYNMNNLGVSGGDFIKLTNFDGAKFCLDKKEYFDRILLDAPCSAEARMVMGEPRTFSFWKESQFKILSYNQRKLLFSAWGALKKGGVLVYSTCTFAPEENEEQIDRLIKKFEGQVQIMPAKIGGLESIPPVLKWNEKIFNPEIKKTLCLLPTKEMEGFFVAKIRKI